MIEKLSSDTSVSTVSPLGDRCTLSAFHIVDLKTHIRRHQRRALKHGARHDLGHGNAPQAHRNTAPP